MTPEQIKAFAKAVRQNQLEDAVFAAKMSRLAYHADKDAWTGVLDDLEEAAEGGAPKADAPEGRKGENPAKSFLSQLEKSLGTLNQSDS